MIHSITLVIIPILAAQAEQPATDALSQARSQQQKWNEFYAEEAAGYVIRLDGGSELELQSEAVLFWSHPVRGGETNGSVFVWTHHGRAKLVGTVFSYLVRGMRTGNTSPVSSIRSHGNRCWRNWTTNRCGPCPRRGSIHSESPMRPRRQPRGHCG